MAATSAHTRALIYVPPNLHSADYVGDCQTFAASCGLWSLTVRDVAVVDLLLNAGWAHHVIVARQSHAVVGWPVLSVSAATTHRIQLGDVVRLPRLGGRHRAPTDSLVGRVMRHPTQELQHLARTPAHRLIDNRVQQWAEQFPGPQTRN